MTVRSVFISGASSGIGRTATIALADQNWTVFAAALPDENLESLTQQTDERVLTIPLDITDDTSVKAAVQRVSTMLDGAGLDALVNSAGIHIPAPLETLCIADLQRQFDVNVYGHLRLIQGLLPLLRQSKTARIVNISSLMGEVAMPVLGAYSMSKHALEAMTDVLRMELAPQQIDVISIQPGAIQTPMTQQMTEHLEQVRLNLSDEQRELYDRLVSQMTTALASQGKNAISPEKATTTIIHALTDQQPQARYVIGGSTKGAILMRRFAPEKIADSILKRTLGIKSSSSH